MTLSHSYILFRRHGNGCDDRLATRYVIALNSLLLIINTRPAVHVQIHHLD